jgi:hypothetical protein
MAVTFISLRILPDCFQCFPRITLSVADLVDRDRDQRIGLLNCVSIERQGGTAPDQGAYGVVQDHVDSFSERSLLTCKDTETVNYQLHLEQSFAHCNAINPIAKYQLLRNTVQSFLRNTVRSFLYFSSSAFFFYSLCLHRYR